AIAFYIFLYIPIIVVVITSFNDARIAIAWRGFTTFRKPPTGGRSTTGASSICGRTPIRPSRPA
ncbi:MAG: hypothetical protein R3266_12945, partial [Gemmatimonadota bacterium]|nr:hypothetical protein [Gemmatimonadota bacterium]